jgi:DNA-binding response OmpR family regulator
MARILVLDDMLDAVNLIKRILQKEGHAVIGFTEEEEALNYMRTHPIDLAILDIKLKKMSGVEVLEAIKRIDPSTGVMMLTAYPSIESERRSIKLGAGAFCVKPIDNEELVEKVTNVLKPS